MPAGPVVDAAYIAAAQKTLRTLRHAICSEHSLPIAQVWRTAWPQVALSINKRSKSKSLINEPGVSLIMSSIGRESGASWCV